MHDSIDLLPKQSISGEILLPGSKSLSNRYLLLASLAEGQTHLQGLLQSDDTKIMLDALSELAINYSFASDGTCTIDGRGGYLANHSEKKHLFLGLAGTAYRPLLAVLCFGKGQFVLDGVERMRERPIQDLVVALESLGADVRYLKEIGYPPVEVNALSLSGAEIEVSGELSSQFVTALLMAMPLATSDSQLNIQGELVSKPYVDMTLATMKQFGVSVHPSSDSMCYKVQYQTYQSPKYTIHIEPDVSSASYFFASAAISQSSIKVLHISREQTLQREIEFLDALEQMGVLVSSDSLGISVEGTATLKGIDISCENFIDTAMTLAVVALFAEGKTTLRSIYNWRLKETDRLNAMVCELRKVGAMVESGQDYLVITPPKEWQFAEIETYGDHRMAMAFSLLIFSPKGCRILDPECVNKTFPNYFETYLKLIQ